MVELDVCFRFVVSSLFWMTEYLHNLTQKHFNGKILELTKIFFKVLGRKLGVFMVEGKFVDLKSFLGFSR